MASAVSEGLGRSPKYDVVKVSGEEPLFRAGDYARGALCSPIECIPDHRVHLSVAATREEATFRYGGIGCANNPNAIVRRIWGASISPAYPSRNTRLTWMICL